MDRRKRLRRGRMIFLGIGILVVLLNVAAWNSAPLTIIRTQHSHAT